MSVRRTIRVKFERDSDGPAVYVNTEKPGTIGPGFIRYQRSETQTRILREKAGASRAV